jgi:hypothetical protein
MHTESAHNFLKYEAKALLQRLEQVKPFALHLPMVAAAAPSVPAQAAIESFLSDGRRSLRLLIARYIAWLEGPGKSATPAEGQRRFVLLRLRFLTVTTQFEIFADALSQRSQHGYGEWLGGLDVAAGDALELPGTPYEAPPLICYLDRGHGAAIRRARTRLPGGGDNPVGIIRIPRERMVGSGISSSLVHEVGHQGAALLDLVDPLREKLRARQTGRERAVASAWSSYGGWISEIIADFWSVARLGIASTMGLMSVVALPRPFVFRVTPGEVHPTPWIRVKISCAIGRALFPDPQWDRAGAMWEALYPLEGLDTERRVTLAAIESVLPEFVRLLIGHRPEALRGRTLGEAMPLDEVAPHRLRQIYAHSRSRPEAMAELDPMVALAAVGQAKFDGAITADQESRVVVRLLRYWALKSSVDSSLACAATPRKASRAARGALRSRAMAMAAAG